MDRRLRHRGPDDSGVRHSPLGVFGMRRLSIIDLDSGKQPISNESGRIWVTLNGEIYNYRELRRELETEGHAFRTSSDTEVLVHAYESFGDALVEHLRGMFAFAIFDETKERVLFGRDRIGKKPLYLARVGERLIYASELKAILTVPGLDSSINMSAFWHYLTFKNVPAPLTIYAGVMQLRPGEIAVYDARTQQLQTKTYWRPAFSGDREISEEQAANDLLGHLREAVALRMEASDVPVGAFLSGGLDSSLVVALMAERSTKPIKTFSVGYTESVSHKSDIHYAREMSLRYGTDHHELMLSVQSVAESLIDVACCFDEPFAGTITSYWLSRLIGSEVKVALSGDGADELFGSYAHHRMAAAVQCARDSAYGSSSFGFFADRPQLISDYARMPDFMWRTQFSAFNDAEKRELLSGDVSLFEPSADILRPYYDGAAAGDAVNRTLEVDCRTLLPDQVLTYVDRLSMAHSLEVRVPFLDHKLIEYASGLPARMKVTTNETKRVLKRAARAYLPDNVIDRPKEGFVLPADAWLNSAFDPLLNDVFSPAWMEHGYFRAPYVKRLIAEHASGQANNTYKIWTLVMFQIWHQTYVVQRRSFAAGCSEVA